jgi:hypothetical protein
MLSKNSSASFHVKGLGVGVAVAAGFSTCGVVLEIILTLFDLSIGINGSLLCCVCVACIDVKVGLGVGVDGGSLSSSTGLCPVGSTNLTGLLSTYAYRSQAWGSPMSSAE